MHQDTTLNAGAVVAGKYRLTERLGSGGMGEVWAAEHLGLGSTVAVKLLHHDIPRRSDVAKRFEHEARAAAALAGDHVVRVFDHGFEGDTPFIVMERLEGETLAARVRREGALEPKVTARIVEHLARALGKAHDAGIIHRDVKPENVFLARGDAGEVVKLLDFGIAKVSADIARRAGPTRTRSGALMGTPHYMSPEQLRERPIDHRADLWSLALVAFECMTGTSAFGGEGGDAAAEVIAEVLSGPMPVPSERRAVPNGFDEWFAHAASRDPVDRFASARDMADSLTALVDGEVGTTTTAPLVLSETSRRPWRRATIAAVFAAIAAVVLVVMRGRDEPAPPVAPVASTTASPEPPSAALPVEPPAAASVAAPASPSAAASEVASARRPSAPRRPPTAAPSATASAVPTAIETQPEPAPVSSPTHPLGF